MDIGSLIKVRQLSNDLNPPVFIWDIIEKNGKKLFVINSEKGLSKVELQNKFQNEISILPDGAQFKIEVEKSFLEKYEKIDDKDYEFITDLILSATRPYNQAPQFFTNSAYIALWIGYCFKFTESKYCEEVLERITESPYFLAKQLPEFKDLREYVSYVALELLLKRFALLKLVSKLKDIVNAISPPDNDQYPNAIFEKLILGMFLSYYQEHKEKINSVTVNYSQKFPGDYKVLYQFTSMLTNFEHEMNMYKAIKAEELKGDLLLVLQGVKVPEKEEGKGILMKLIEFDLPFWQRLILLDIDKHVPVRKLYKGGISEAYNYMLLLPLFRWLAPHHFPHYTDKKVNAETYNKMMVQRMKKFVEGKIS